MVHISDIKLIRTDTTLDLSQKAEKGMNCSVSGFVFYFPASVPCPLSYTMWDFWLKTNDSKPCILLYYAGLDLHLVNAVAGDCLLQLVLFLCMAWSKREDSQNSQGLWLIGLSILSFSCPILPTQDFFTVKSCSLVISLNGWPLKCIES